MKQRYLLTTIIQVFVFQNLFAQTPGGVGTPEVWAQDTASVRISSSVGLTYVGVSKIVNEKEQAIWSLGNANGITRIQTTARTADLNRGTFMNYAQDSLADLRLYSYTTSSNMSDTRELHIGNVQNGKLPVRNVDRNVVEYAIYNRRLSNQERQRVESYMALKYGISLRNCYLNSRGTVVWNAYANKNYNHRIAGIISDTLSALHMNRARSSEEGYFLTVSTDNYLTDGQSLLWGDNNGKLAFSNSKAHGKWLGRRWAFSALQMDNLSVDMTADLCQLRQIQPLSDGESFYLAVDPTGTGKFPVKTLQYHKANSVAGDSIVFKNIHAGEKDVLTIRAAKDMFTTIDVHQPDETNGNTGSLDILVTGGMPPYRMQLNRDHISVYDRAHGDSLQNIDNLMEGIYLLTTTDKIGNVSEHEFQISTTGITELPSDQVTDNGDGLFAHVCANPNPATDGYVRVQVELSSDVPLEMILYTIGGAKVNSLSFSADTYFSTIIYLPSTGAYLLTLKSGTHEKSIKLMRK